MRTETRHERRERRWNMTWAALVLGASIWGCTATTPPPPPPETVGTLTAGPSVWAPPVHATTDLVDTFEESRRRPAAKPAAPAPAPAATEDAPEVAPKTDGVEIGEVRQ